MSNTVIVWDLETVPDLDGFAKANGLEGKPQEEVRAAIGDEFPKLIYHSIVCIGALIARRSDAGWTVIAAESSTTANRSEKQLIQSFVKIIEDLRPQMVTFNGGSFDLPVLRYRAMIHRISAPGLSARSYFHRFTEDAVDLCDVLASYSPGGKVKLDELCKIMGLDGKPNGMNGSDVEAYYKAGRLEEIADYCLSDVINTYRLWLRYELFGGKLCTEQSKLSDDSAIQITKISAL